MKGVVLSLPVRNRRKSRRSLGSALSFIRLNIPALAFVAVFAAGVAGGVLAFLRCDSGFLEDLDFLFLTNIESARGESMLSSFVSHFASNFLFVLVTVLCGLSPWGVGIIPLCFAFKGFGTGISAAYLMSTYGFKGFGFYLGVVLPGTFVFSVSLLYLCIESSSLTFKISKAVFLSHKEGECLSPHLRAYLSKCVRCLFVSALGASVDMLLWQFIADLFF